MSTSLASVKHGQTPLTPHPPLAAVLPHSLPLRRKQLLLEALASGKLRVSNIGGNSICLQYHLAARGDVRREELLENGQSVNLHTADLPVTVYLAMQADAATATAAMVDDSSKPVKSESFSAYMMHPVNIKSMPSLPMASNDSVQLQDSNGAEKTIASEDPPANIHHMPSSPTVSEGSARLHTSSSAAQAVAGDIPRVSEAASESACMGTSMIAELPRVPVAPSDEGASGSPSRDDPDSLSAQGARMMPSRAESEADLDHCAPIVYEHTESLDILHNAMAHPSLIDSASCDTVEAAATLAYEPSRAVRRPTRVQPATADGTHEIEGESISNARMTLLPSRAPASAVILLDDSDDETMGDEGLLVRHAHRYSPLSDRERRQEGICIRDDWEDADDDEEDVLEAAWREYNQKRRTAGSRAAHSSEIGGQGTSSKKVTRGGGVRDANANGLGAASHIVHMAAGMACAEAKPSTTPADATTLKAPGWSEDGVAQGAVCASSVSSVCSHSGARAEWQIRTHGRFRCWGDSVVQEQIELAWRRCAAGLMRLSSWPVGLACRWLGPSHKQHVLAMIRLCDSQHQTVFHLPCIADMLQPLTSTSRTSASRCSCPQALCAASALASLRVGGQSVAAPPRIPRIGLSGSSGYGQTVLGTPLPIMVARGHSSATQFRPSTTVSDVRFPACHRAPLHTGGPSCYPRQTRQAAPSREAPTSLQYWCRVPLFRVPRPLPTRRVPLPRPSRGPRPRRPPWRLRRVDEQGSKI